MLFDQLSQAKALVEFAHQDQAADTKRRKFLIAENRRPLGLTWICSRPHGSASGRPTLGGTRCVNCRCMNRFNAGPRSSSRSKVPLSPSGLCGVYV